ncbi:hypothetical protein FS837_008390 [Tulasnella sp. UAMH 9824]|nr:hypothetical protein FS837_008390 [Tulasnella sp. UAMH 9824]
MPTPSTHYRIALGENNGKHSWIIHSAKGIKWRNIPDDLVMLLQKLGIDELLDFSLGSDGRWYVRYRQNGPETYEISPYPLMELGQDSNVELERLALGPGVSHWGVYRTADGLFQPFSSVTNRFSRLMDPEAEGRECSSQIDFISLGYGGWWAFGVNGRVEYRCGKPFRNILTNGQKAHKRVSTIVLSPMARVWIIVWENGTLSHNLPPNMATEVEDYCQLRHSLKVHSNRRNFEQPRSQKARHRRNNESETNSSAQIQLPTTDTTETASQENRHDYLMDKAQSSSTQLAIIDPPNVASVPATTLTAPSPVPRPIAPLPVPRAPMASASTLTRHPATKPVPARLPVSPIEVPKAPSMGNTWNATQSAWTQQSIKTGLNATSVPATALRSPPPVTPTVIATPLPTAQMIRKSTPFQKADAEPGPTRLPTTSVQFPKAPYVPIVKPVQATQSTTRAIPRVPLAWRNMSLLSEPDSQPDRTTSRVEAVLAKPYFYVPPRKLSTTLRLLDPSVARLFEDGWKHQQKQLPKIKRIFAISLPDHLNDSYEEYK